MSIKRLIKTESGQFYHPFVQFQFLITIIIFIAGIAIHLFANYRKGVYDADVKAILENAAKAQAAYYRDNGTYTANIDSLTGFNQSDNVTIVVEATETNYVIAGKVTNGCEADTGTWFISSTTGAIDGTPCSRP